VGRPESWLIVHNWRTFFQLPDLVSGIASVVKRKSRAKPGTTSGAGAGLGFGVLDLRRASCTGWTVGLVDAVSDGSVGGGARVAVGLGRRQGSVSDGLLRIGQAPSAQGGHEQ
jgi:hypothetical protein